MIDPEMRDLQVEWQAAGMGPQHSLLAVTQTHGDNTKTTLYLTRRQADRVAEFVREGNVAPTATPAPLCELCHHSLKDNLHGFDQNDADFDGDNLVHSGHCTYCKECNPALGRLLLKKRVAAGTSGPKGEA